MKQITDEITSINQQRMFWNGPSVHSSAWYRPTVVDSTYGEAPTPAEGMKKSSGKWQLRLNTYVKMEVQVEQYQ